MPLATRPHARRLALFQAPQNAAQMASTPVENDHLQGLYSRLWSKPFNLQPTLPDTKLWAAEAEAHTAYGPRMEARANTTLTNVEEARKRRLSLHLVICQSASRPSVPDRNQLNPLHRWASKMQRHSEVHTQRTLIKARDPAGDLLPFCAQFSKSTPCHAPPRLGSHSILDIRPIHQTDCGHHRNIFWPIHSSAGGTLINR